MQYMVYRLNKVVGLTPCEGESFCLNTSSDLVRGVGYLTPGSLPADALALPLGISVVSMAAPVILPLPTLRGAVVIG
nr:unnamed protein product [Spirometra erinaceieuropaei]